MFGISCCTGIEVVTLKRPESSRSLIGTVESHIEYNLNRSLLTTTFVFAAQFIRLLKITQKLWMSMALTCTKKRRSHGLFGSPSAPVIRWEAATEAYASDVAKNIPPVTSGVMYTHLSMHAGQQRDVQSSHLGMYTLGIRPH